MNCRASWCGFSSSSGPLAAVGRPRTDRPEEELRHRHQPQHGDRYPGALLHSAQFPLGVEARGLQTPFFEASSSCCTATSASTAATPPRRWNSWSRREKVDFARGFGGDLPRGHALEGRRDHGRFKAGAFTLAKRPARDPSVVLTGTKTDQKNLAFNWGNRITVRVLPPVPAERVAALETHELMQTVHERMCTALGEVRNEKLKVKDQKVKCPRTRKNSKKSCVELPADF